MNDPAANIGAQTQAIAEALEDTLDAAAGAPVVFALIFQVGGVTQYVSNGQREGVKLVLQDVLATWDDGTPGSYPGPRGH